VAVGCRRAHQHAPSRRCVPGKVLIVSRTTYEPGTHLAMHYHTSQIVFYILREETRFEPRVPPSTVGIPERSLVLEGSKRVSGNRGVDSRWLSWTKKEGFIC
jgi:hypothetical protein